MVKVDKLECGGWINNKKALILNSIYIQFNQSLFNLENWHNFYMPILIGSSNFFKLFKNLDSQFIEDFSCIKGFCCEAKKIVSDNILLE